MTEHMGEKRGRRETGGRRKQRYFCHNRALAKKYLLQFKPLVRNLFLNDNLGISQALVIRKTAETKGV